MRLIFKVLFLLILTKNYAQYSVGLNFGMMRFIGDSYSYYTSKYEAGINILGKYNVNKDIRLGLNLGYFYNNDGTIKVRANPLTGLLEYSFLNSNVRPYAGISLGVYRLAYSFVDAFSKNPNPHSNFYFGFAPIIGIEYGLTKKLFLTANSKFNYIFTRTNGYGENSNSIELTTGIAYLFEK